MRKDLIKKLQRRGFDPEDLKKKYKKQVQRIRENFPQESARRILKDLDYETFLKNTLKKGTLKDKTSED